MGDAGGANTIGPQGRTLDDAFAEMMRPMLRQWLAENMPRIVEAALRAEVSGSVKPGEKT